MLEGYNCSVLSPNPYWKSEHMGHGLFLPQGDLSSVRSSRSGTDWSVELILLKHSSYCSEVQKFGTIVISFWYFKEKNVLEGQF